MRTLGVWKCSHKGPSPHPALRFLNGFDYVIRLGAESPTGVDQALGRTSVKWHNDAAQGPFGAFSVEPSQREPAPDHSDEGTGAPSPTDKRRDKSRSLGAPPPRLHSPANVAAPSLSGDAQDGQTLSASLGTWSSNPTSYSYQWQRCVVVLDATLAAGTYSYVVSGGRCSFTLSVTSPNP